MKLLVVEDEQEIAKFLKKNLEEQCFSVDVANDGEAGLKLAKSNQYDLIILDHMLPKRTGLEICSELRHDGNNTPILILSVRSEIVTKVDLFNAGADDYLTKPFSFDELIARIRALMRRPKQMNGEILTIKDLVLDTRKHGVKRGKKDIYLTRKEFQLLEYLMRNQGAVLSRSMLMEHVWDMNTDPFSNTIEAHIVSLRKKIDADSKDPLIQTISGRGYKIKED